MKYCLFCREAFEDDINVCPYCSDELSDTLPGPDEEHEPHGGTFAGKDEPVDSADDENIPLVQVAIIESEAGLRAAVEVLKVHGIYFEIEETDRAKARAGIVARRAWRLLADADEAHRAFLNLVEEAPGLFPSEVRKQFAEPPDVDEAGRGALMGIIEILDSGDEHRGEELAAAIISGFAADDPEAVAAAKNALVTHGAVAPLLADIAGQSISAGGEGAERVLFNTLEILEAMGYVPALERIEPHYDSPVPQVRARAAYAAGRLGITDGVDALLPLLEDEDEDVRYEASEAVWRLTGLEFEFDPYASLEDEADNVKRITQAWARRSGSR